LTRPGRRCVQITSARRFFVLVEREPFKCAGRRCLTDAKNRIIAPFGLNY